MKKTVLILVLFIGFIGCSSLPGSFVRTMEPTWSTLELRDGLQYEEAWNEVTDLVAKKFQLEMISKDGAYLRTAWNFTWWRQGEFTENYRVRAIVKFSPKRDKVDIKTEAHYLDGGQWILGTDTRLLQTLKTDIMGVVGRTTR